MTQCEKRLFGSILQYPEIVTTDVIYGVVIYGDFSRIDFCCDFFGIDPPKRGSGLVGNKLIIVQGYEPKIAQYLKST